MRRRTRSSTALLAVVFAVAGCTDDAPSLSVAAEEGRALAQARGCAACHAGVGSDSTIGPSWRGLWGTTVTLDDGSQVVADEAYVRASARTPDAQRRPGDWVRMPTFSPDQLSDTELDLIIAYLRELGDQ